MKLLRIKYCFLCCEIWPFALSIKFLFLVLTELKMLKQILKSRKFIHIFLSCSSEKLQGNVISVLGKSQAMNDIT
jgi:hypothetical protein